MQHPFAAIHTLRCKLMRVALYNPFPGGAFAETELVERLKVAARNLNWQPQEFATSSALRSWNPDFVLVLHHNAAKLWPQPTYGCLWNPPAFMEQHARLLKNVMSYDGHLTSSPIVERWVKDLLYASPKPFHSTPFYTSCHATPYREPTFENPKLVYIGTNWDGPRFQPFFEHLDSLNLLDIYGPQSKWPFAKNSYRGELPFNGTSVLDALHQGGLALCLHRPEHIEAEIPSMRIFEIAASSTLALCQDHPFIRKTFGDSVLYLTGEITPESTLKQIQSALQFVQQKPAQARAMTRQAHQIFSQNFTFEKLLTNVAQLHQSVLARKFNTPVSPTNQPPHIEFIMRIGSRPITTIRRALASIAAQTHPNITVLLVRYAPVADLEKLLAEFRPRLNFRIIDTPPGNRSRHLWDGLASLTADYFAILDDDDEIFPHHTASLLHTLHENPTAGLAYSGSIRYWENDPTTLAPAKDESPVEPGELFSLDRPDKKRLLQTDNFIMSNAWLARRSLLDATIAQDPELPVAEDFFLLLYLASKTPFAFTHEATACFYWRTSKTDNSTFDPASLWSASYKRIHFLLNTTPFDSHEFLPAVPFTAPPNPITSTLDYFSTVSALWQLDYEPFIKTLFRLFLSREVDLQGFASCALWLHKGAPRSALVSALATCDESRGRNLRIDWLPRLRELEPLYPIPNLKRLWEEPDPLFIRAAYEILLGRRATPQEFQQSLDSLTTGLSRARLIHQIAAKNLPPNPTWLPHLATIDPDYYPLALDQLSSLPNPEFITALFPLLLSRPVDPAGLASFTEFLAAGNPRRKLIEIIATSEEARARHLNTQWLANLK